MFNSFDLKMKVLFSTFLLLKGVSGQSEVNAEEFKLSGLFFGCDRDITSEYHRGLQDFSTRMYKSVASLYGYHFALSQYSIWLSLSAIAEGTNGAIQQQMFKSLNLPQDQCIREKYYEIATSLESPGNDVTLSRKRLLVLDESLKVNETWMKAVRASGLADTKIAAVENPESTNQIREFIGLSNLVGSGNSMILDALNYEGLWTTAFADAPVKEEDFFDDNGDKIGTVSMLRTRKRVKLAYIPLLNAKLMELPVGNSGRYRMLFMMNLGRTPIKHTIEHFPSTFIVDSMPLLLESLVPLEVAVPRVCVTSELDLRKVLKYIGMETVWNGSGGYISNPPPTPSVVTQRVTIKLTSEGLTAPAPPGLTTLATGLAAAVGRDFVANRPFVYGLVDSQTRTWLFSGVYSRPSTALN